MKKSTKVETNSPAVRDAMAYCQGTICLLDEVKLMPEFDPGIIQKLKDKLPDINVYTEIKGEKDLEKGPSSYWLNRQNWEAELKADVLFAKLGLKRA
ncbi:MAG: hypothetical protein ABSB79_12600 [Syntrophales bacterium]